MERNRDYLFKKIVDWIFRKKTLLYFLVMALFREFLALGTGDTISKWEIDENLQDWYFHYPIMALKFVFNGGDWNVVYILVGLIVLFKIAELIESFFINKKVSEDKKENEFTEKKTIIKAKKIKKVVNIDKVKGDVYL